MRHGSEPEWTSENRLKGSERCDAQTTNLAKSA
jgi:hypothetical protein